MIKSLRYVLFLLLITITTISYAQLPVISYSSPQVYFLGTAITPLVPTSSGVALPSGTNTPVTLASGFNNITGVAVDHLGNVYVVENLSNAIGEIPVGGGATITLGSGFITPTGVAVDAAGNVYVVDNGNDAVKEIPVGGGPIVTLGSGFNSPYGVAVDAAGNLYIGDSNNNEVKEILAGTNSTIIVASGLDHPTGVAVDAAGNVYVADRASNTIKKILKVGGTIVTLATGDGNPNGVAVDSFGDVYFADTDNTSIEEIPVGGGSLISIGSGFITPTAVAVNGANVVFVGDNGSTAVKEIGPAGGYFISPALPAGLSLDNATGIISGTPTAISPATNYTVTGYNSTGGTSATVNITVTNALLSSISLNPVSPLTTVTGPGFMNYTAAVANTVTGISVIPTARVAGTTITVNGVAVASGVSSASIPLSVGANTIMIVATPTGGGTGQTYIITVGRGSSNDALSTITLTPYSTLTNTGTTGSTTTYTTSVSNATASLKVTPTTSDPTATITVNGIAVTSGTASGTITLGAEGTTTTINTVVTAQNKITIRTYSIAVARAPSSNASLTSISLTPASSLVNAGTTGNTTTYTTSVSNATTSVKVTPTTQDLNAIVTVNGVAVTSGTASGSFALAEGTTTTINTVVTAQDGTTSRTYSIVVTRAASNNAGLTNLAISSGTLTPVFAAGTTSYTASVANAVTGVTLTPTTGDPNATVKVNGIAVTPGTASGTIALAEGATTTINTVVTAQDNITTKTYAIAVTRAKSANATLSNLVLSTGTLTPAFTAGIISYTASVASATTSVTITPTASDANATIKVNGTAIISGTASASLPLAVGTNNIIVVVTAQDGITTQTYIATVGRGSNVASLSVISLSTGSLTPVSGTNNFTASVSNTVTSAKVTPTTTDPSATVTVALNGGVAAAVTSGTASASLPLNLGTNTITTVVTAQDGVTIKTYIITVTRVPSNNASLTSITLTPASSLVNTGTSGSTTTYTTSVSGATASVKVTPTVQDPTATVTVNGIAVTSGTASGSIALAVGANTINTVVTAQDGTTTRTYSIVVTRPVLSPVIAYTTPDIFTAGVIIGPLAPVNTGGTPTSYSISGTLPAGLTFNTITGVISGTPTVVTAATNYTVSATNTGGTGSTVLNITVKKAPSNNASLTSITLTPASSLVNTGTTGTTTTYTTSVSNATTSVKVTPTVQDPTATVKVNGIAVTSGTASGSIALAVGANTINTVVTAQDGITTRTYSITVTRATGPLMSLYQSVSVTKPINNVTIESDGVVVHQGLSPNGDGINDILTIDGITAYPNNNLTIIDRSGSLIFQAKGYDNSSKAFDGHSGINGKMQQPGTYFYSLDYVADGQNRHKTGYIILRY